jgi:hypothetical protein
VKGLALADREPPQTIERPVCPGEQRSRLVEQGGPDIGEVDASRSTDEQRRSDLALEGTDLL